MALLLALAARAAPPAGRSVAVPVQSTTWQTSASVAALPATVAWGLGSVIVGTGAVPGPGAGPCGAGCGGAGCGAGSWPAPSGVVRSAFMSTPNPVVAPAMPFGLGAGTPAAV